MTEIKVIIVDDEPSCVDTLSLLLKAYHQEVKILATAHSVESGLKAIEMHKDNLDIMFLDIQMPGGNGFSLLQQIPDIRFKVIFTTAYDKFALKAIKYSALDYLLKPIDNDELAMALKKFKDTPKAITIEQEYLNAFKTAISQKKVFEKIGVPTLNEIRFIQVSDIIYFQGDNNYTTIHLSNSQKVVSSKNIGYYEELLDAASFCRIHNSYLVNIARIESYQKGKGGYVVLDNGQTLEVSVRRKDVLLKTMGLI